MTTWISSNFTLEEATDSQYAVRNGIDNDVPPELIENLRHAAYGMEAVRTELGDRPIIVSSWYRNKEVNAGVGGSKNSRHMLAFAVDFTCPGFGAPREIVEHLCASAIPFGQVILEFNRWVHIDFDGSARQALIIDQTGTRPFE